MSRLIVDQGIASGIQTLNSIIQVACETKKTCKFEEFLEMVVITLIIYFIASFVEAELHAGDLNYQRIVQNIRLLAGSLTVVLLVFIINIPYFGDLLLSLWICVFIWLTWNSYEELIGLLHQTFHLLQNRGGDALCGLKKLVASLCGSEATNNMTRDANGSAHDINEEEDVEQVSM